MQLFVSDSDFRTCAIHLDDYRCNKIIVEAAQISSTALWKTNCDLAETMYSKGEIYLPTHENCELCKWAASSFHNFQKTVNYGLALFEEYLYRFGKPHKTLKILLNLLSINQEQFKVFGKDTPMINYTTNFKHIEDIHEAYKHELILKWNTDKKQPVWTKRVAPIFYLNNC